MLNGRYVPIVLKKSVSKIDRCSAHMTAAQIDLQPTIGMLATVRGPLKIAENSEKRLFQHNKSEAGIATSASVPTNWS
jgi:hypothetical protein